MEKQAIPMVFTINKNYKKKEDILKIRNIMLNFNIGPLRSSVLFTSSLWHSSVKFTEWINEWLNV